MDKNDFSNTNKNNTDNKGHELSNLKANAKNINTNELMKLSIIQRRELLTKYDVEDDDCDSDWSS